MKLRRQAQKKRHLIYEERCCKIFLCSYILIFHYLLLPICAQILVEMYCFCKIAREWTTHLVSYVWKLYVFQRLQKTDIRHVYQTCLDVCKTCLQTFEFSAPQKTDTDRMHKCLPEISNTQCMHDFKFNINVGPFNLVI